MNKILQSWIQFLNQYYWMILLIILLIGCFSFPRMVQIFKSISSDPIDLLPKNYPSVQTLLKVREKAEPKTPFDIFVESENPTQSLKLIEDLQKKIIQNPQVEKAIYRKPGHDFFYHHKLLFLELEDLQTIRDRIDKKIRHTKLGSLYIDFEGEKDLVFDDIEKKYRSENGSGNHPNLESEYFVSPNGKVFGLFIESKKSNLGLGEAIKFQDSILEAVQSINSKSYDPTIKIYFDRPAKILEYKSLIQDLKQAGIVAGILIFLPLLIRFRRPQFILLIFLPIAFGIPITFALVSFYIEKLNVTTSFLFAILGGLGVESGIHLFSRYYQKRGEGESKELALADLYKFYGPAVFTSVASLSVTFFLMLFSDFRGFSEFGLIGGVGLLVVFCLYFTFFPALLFLAEKIGLLKFKSSHHKISYSPFRFSPSPFFLKTLLLFFCAITILSAFAIPSVQFEYDSKKIRADNPALSFAKEKRKEVTGNRVNNPAIVIVENEDEAKELKKEIYIRKNRNPHSTLHNVFSYYSLVPDDQSEKMKLIEEIKKLLNDPSLKLVKSEKRKEIDRFKEMLELTHLVKKEEIPEEVQKLFIGKQTVPGTLFFINAKPALELGNGKNAIAFSNEIEKIETSKKTFYSGSDAIVYANVLKTMFQDSKKVLTLSIAALFFFVFIDFRSIKKTCIIIFSILTGLSWVLGILYLFNFKMNIYNMVMIPSIMGMSIDNSIHIYHSYEELGKGSMLQILRTTGLSSLLASLTNASGFISLLVCHHGGLRSMGVVSTIGLMTCLITTLLFLPLILYFFENHRKKNLKNF